MKENVDASCRREVVATEQPPEGARPIRSAPKGVTIELWPRLDRPRSKEWTRGIWDNWFSCWYMLDVGHLNGLWRPTHWRPMPDPPEPKP